MTSTRAISKRTMKAFSGGRRPTIACSCRPIDRLVPGSRSRVPFEPWRAIIGSVWSMATRTSSRASRTCRSFPAVWRGRQPLVGRTVVEGQVQGWPQCGGRACSGGAHGDPAQGRGLSARASPCRGSGDVAAGRLSVGHSLRQEHASSMLSPARDEHDDNQVRHSPDRSLPATRRLIDLLSSTSASTWSVRTSLLKIPTRKLAREALTGAGAGYDRNEVEHFRVDELVEFAMTTYRNARALPEYRSLGRRRSWGHLLATEHSCLPSLAPSIASSGRCGDIAGASAASSNEPTSRRFVN